MFLNFLKKEYSTRFSCKYTGKTLKMFAYRVHAHSHGDVNAAYRVRQHEWLQLAKGDPQWPQAFYPTEAIYDIKDGDALLGSCTYHNDGSSYIYAGNTHNDEMCNVYLMYYTDNIEDVMDVCSGSTYPQLESIIPPEAEAKPKMPSNFLIDEEDAKKNVMSHHDMEGSKTHHQISNSNNNNNKENGKSLPQKSLSYFLSNLDDYYDDVEQMRSKNRFSASSEVSNSDNSYLDANALLDAAFNSQANGDQDLEYQSDPSLLLAAAELAKLNSNGNNKKYSNSNNNNKLNSRIKGTLNSLLSPKTISSKKFILSFYSCYWCFVI